MTANGTASSRNTHLRPIASESQAHKKRPAPLEMEMMLTSPAAVAALTPVISCAIGDASGLQPSGGFDSVAAAAVTTTR